MFSKSEMPFDHFLKLVTVLKVLYGAKVATYFFEKNIDLYYDLTSESLQNLQEKAE